MTTAIPATSRSSDATLQTHRSPRTRSFAARPQTGTVATISSAAEAAFAAATAPSGGPAADTQRPSLANAVPAA